MKTIKKGILALIMILGLSVQAQNKNVTEVTKTTVTTVKDSDGTKRQIKNEKTSEVQNIEFKDSESDKLNKDIKATPVQVVSTTQIINPDGSVRTIDVDRSAYYTSNGRNYKMSLDNSGYILMEPKSGKREGTLRKTSNNNYIYYGNQKTSIAYFNSFIIFWIRLRH